MSARLNRMTTEYSPVEDRIRIAGDTEKGPCIIWLNLRLSQRLVQQLFKWLESVPEPVHSDLSPEEKAKQAVQQSSPMEQMIAQQSASAAIKPQQAVQVPTDTEQWLATAIDVKFTADGENIILNFRSQQNHQTYLALNKGVIRQWLAIVYKNYRTAEWPLTVWPDWFIQAEHKSQAKPESKQLH